MDRLTQYTNASQEVVVSRHALYYRQMSALLRGPIALICLVAVVTTPLVAQSGVTVVGRVHDEAGAAVRAALVFAGAGPEHTTTTDVQGFFRLDGVPPEVRRVGVRATGFGPVDVDVPAGSPTRDVGVVVLPPGVAPVATIGGVVSDAETGTPVEGVEIEVRGGASVVSDAGGRFRIEGVAAAWGANTLSVRGLGYETRTVTAWFVEPGRPVEVAVELTTRPVALPGVLVASAPPTPDMTALLSGFSDRRLRTQGFFLDHEEIRARNPGGVTELMRSVPGVRIRPAIEGTEVVFTRRGRSMRGFRGGADATSVPGDCRAPLVFVDGVLAHRDSEEHVDLDDFAAPSEIAGFEVYNGASQVPPIFNTLGSTCGVVAIWTVHYRAPPGATAAAGGTGGPGGPDQLATSGSGWSTKRVVVGVAIGAAAALLFRTAVCSMPHYCTGTPPTSGR